MSDVAGSPVSVTTVYQLITALTEYSAGAPVVAYYPDESRLLRVWMEADGTVHLG